MISGQGTRIAWWRARPRDRELALGVLILADNGTQRKDCFGAETSTRAACASESA
jgi:hypothetical protein